MRHDAVFLVKRHLDLATTACLVYGLAHGVSHRVGIHDDLALGVARRTSDCLDERTAVAQKALFVGIKDRHERYLGQVEALTKQVDAHKDVDLALAQCPQDLDAVQRRRIRMHVVDLDACIEQIVGQILGHTLGQGRNERALFAGATHLDLVEQIIDLPAYRSHVDFWIEQARRANDLLNIVLTHT